MAFDDYYVSRTTLERLENVFKAGYLSVFNLIAESPDFFNGKITGKELLQEFVIEPLNEIKEKEKSKKELHRNQNLEIKYLKMAKHQQLSTSKCHALIHLKHELRQCQNNKLPEDDFCTHHSKLDILPYGRVNFDDEEEDEEDDED
jgi:hypothetical protein